MTLTKTERQLILQYRQQSREQQNIILKLLDLPQQQAKKPADIIVFNPKEQF